MALQLADFKWQTLADGEVPARISGGKLELAVQRGYASPITERVVSIPQSYPPTRAVLSEDTYIYSPSSELMVLLVRFSSSPIGTPPKLRVA